MKRVKKISVLVMAALAVLLVSGCAKKETAQVRAEKDRIAVCLQQLDNPLMLGIADAMVKAFPDQNVEVASAN
ncbi:MAG: hypothetical protein LBT11_00110, partial [Treponema sp.]|nr:hypothetical protein [Treponema sp.]